MHAVFKNVRISNCAANTVDSAYLILCILIIAENDTN
jgi:hypothetical protein